MTVGWSVGPGIASAASSMIACMARAGTASATLACMRTAAGSDVAT